MIKLSDYQNSILAAFAAANPTATTFKRQDMFTFCEEQGFTNASAYAMMKKLPRPVDTRGVYQMIVSNNVVSIKPVAKSNEAAPVATKAPIAAAPVSLKIQSTSSEEVYIPATDPTFVKWGYFADVSKIIKSNMFFPMYVSGLSGNGKTMMIEQACAAAKREYVRIQITPETDEDDLIGGFRLLNGETVFAKGPVIKAMEAGAILLIDEIDRGSTKLMCLQGVLEGKPVLIKKTGEVVQPAEGFNVIATANTKGQGDDNGRFISATIIDEAFLERFTITLEQPYPTAATERKIIKGHMDKFGVDESDYEGFTEKLIQWGQAIRKTFEDGGVDELISTRRLCHIVQTLSIFKDRTKAIELCVNRFDSDTREAFMDLYSKIDLDAAATDDLDTDINTNSRSGSLLTDDAPF